MKNKIILVLGIVFCVHYFCGAQQALTKEQQEKYYPAKKRKFKLAKKVFVLTDTSVITTNAVYVNEQLPIAQEQYATYVYFRFFNDGRMFISYPYKSYPSAEEFNDLSYGEYMRYVIEDGGRIKMEVVGNYNKLAFIYGKSYGDKIMTYVTRRDWKKDRPQPRSVYQKKNTPLR